MSKLMFVSRWMVGMVPGILLLGTVAACSDTPKPIPKDDIRSNADRFNEKMKQEEAVRGKAGSDMRP